MQANYFKISWRRLWREKFYTFINILGLSVGIAFFTVLFVLVRREFQYDTFHKKKIYRIVENIERNGIGERAATVPYPLGEKLAQTYPTQIRQTVRLFDYQIPFTTLFVENQSYNERHFFFADSNFFDFFELPLFAPQDPNLRRNLLSKPNSVVISYQTALKYFETPDCIGKTISFQGDIPLTITGVLADEQPLSHLELDLIASFSSLYQYPIYNHLNQWIWNPCWTYIEFHEGYSPQDLALLPKGNLSHFIKTHFPEILKNFVELEWQPIEEIHLHSHRDYEMVGNGDIRYVYIFIGIAFLVLALAGINFMNLTTAKAYKRAPYVAIQKALGASRSTLMGQFFCETFFVVLIATFFALILIELFLPLLELYFTTQGFFLSSDSFLKSNDTYADQTLTRHLQNSNWIQIALLTGLLLGLESSIYPAIYFSSFRPNWFLQKTVSIQRRSRFFRNALVVMQLTISFFLTLSTLTTYQQLTFLQNKSLGFETKNIIVIPIAHTNLALQYEAFKEALLSEEGIEYITTAEEILGSAHQTRAYKASYFSDIQQDSDSNFIFFPSLAVRPDFIETFNIKVVAGRSFDRENRYTTRSFKALDSLGRFLVPVSHDDTTAVIVNEAMVAHLGWQSPEAAIGKSFSSLRGQERIVGVVENFHFASLHSQVQPFVLDLLSENGRFRSMKYLFIRIDPNKESEALLNISKIRRRYLSETLRFTSLSYSLEKLYQQEERLVSVSKIFAPLSLFLSGLGLFGLAAYISEQQKRNIAIQYALGATFIEILIWLNSDFFKVIGLSLLLGTLSSFFILENWLTSFAYHIEQSYLFYLFTAILIAFLSLLIINLNAWRVALRPPIETIKKAS
ncbi:ABC transporter permease [Hugenholtzia roseola]|uniref:ABC transporter permease n=1 Tax=Hugenholtzia roseola TaxID=1002 RepID=UPI0003FE4EE4|nr:ABC transporter permease [Hugenholtzia roseola]